MAAIVATLVYVPLGIVLVLVLRVAGVAFEASVTFGGTFGVLTGLAVGWLLVFAGAAAYAACVFPWGDKVFAWPRKK